MCYFEKIACYSLFGLILEYIKEDYIKVFKDLWSWAPERFSCVKFPSISLSTQACLTGQGTCITYTCNMPNTFTKLPLWGLLLELLQRFFSTILKDHSPDYWWSLSHQTFQHRQTYFLISRWRILSRQIYGTLE